MQYAILGIASLSLVCSAGTLVIMAKTAKELKTAKITVETKVQDVEAKVNHNAKVVKAALSQLEF